MRGAPHSGLAMLISRITGVWPTAAPVGRHEISTSNASTTETRHDAI